MNFSIRSLVFNGIFAAACLSWAATADAQTTVWSMLGIGADQQSTDPAIQAAAKAKAAKHKICKKKKALAYLAGLGCTPEHPEVGPALLAAMGDPDEPVRYEAVKAVLQTAEGCQSDEQKKEMRKAKGHKAALCDAKKKVEKMFCDCIERLCGKLPPKEHKKLKDALSRKDCENDPTADCPGGRSGSCCSPEISAKLQELAFGRDERGCFMESSTRVRDMAVLALKACTACGGGCNGMNAGVITGSREMSPAEVREMTDMSDLTVIGDSCKKSETTQKQPSQSDLLWIVPLPTPEIISPLPPSPEPPSGQPEDPAPCKECEETKATSATGQRSNRRSHRTIPLRSTASSTRPEILAWTPMAWGLWTHVGQSDWLPQVERLDSATIAERIVGTPASHCFNSRPMPLEIPPFCGRPTVDPRAISAEVLGLSPTPVQGPAPSQVAHLVPSTITAQNPSWGLAKSVWWLSLFFLLAAFVTICRDYCCKIKPPAQLIPYLSVQKITTQRKPLDPSHRAVALSRVSILISSKNWHRRDFPHLRTRIEENAA